MTRKTFILLILWLSALLACEAGTALAPLPTVAPPLTPAPTKTPLLWPTFPPPVAASPTFTPLPTFTPVPTASPTLVAKALALTPTRGLPLTYKFDNGVSATLQTAIRADGEMADRYYRLIGGDATASVTVYAFQDFNALVKTQVETFRALGFTTTEEQERAGWGELICGQGVTGAVFLRMAKTDCWNGVLKSSAQALVSHEYFHAQQGNLAGRRFSATDPQTNIPVAGPDWLIEGSAEYFAYRAVANAKVIKYDPQRIQFVLQAAGVTQPLEKLDTFEAFAAQADKGSYPLAALAVEYLVWGKGDGVLVKYYRAIGEGLPWRNAFLNAFGLTPEEFYKNFEAYRRTRFVLTPSGKVKGKITDGGGKALSKVYVWVCTVSTNSCDVSRTETDGTYEVTLPPGTYTLWLGQDEVPHRGWGGYVNEQTLSTDPAKLKQIKVDDQANVMVNVVVR